jgi:hypothetical protein
MKLTSTGNHTSSAAAGTPRCDDRLNSGHHRGIKRRPARSAKTISPLEPLQVHLINRAQNSPDKMILRQPLLKRRRHQQQLIPVTTNEFMSHTGSVLKPADDTDIPTAWWHRACHCWPE